MVATGEVSVQLCKCGTYLEGAEDADSVNWSQCALVGEPVCAQTVGPDPVPTIWQIMIHLQTCVSLFWRKQLLLLPPERDQQGPNMFNAAPRDRPYGWWPHIDRHIATNLTDCFLMGPGQPHWPCSYFGGARTRSQVQARADEIKPKVIWKHIWVWLAACWICRPIGDLLNWMEFTLRGISKKLTWKMRGSHARCSLMIFFHHQKIVHQTVQAYFI